MPEKQRRLVETWAEVHRDELRNDWELLRAGQPPCAIESPMNLRNLLVFAVAINVCLTARAAADRTQARSMAITRYGIVATEQTLASQVGATILAQGGNAVDAAVAANATVGLVEPMANGIGGDLFAIVYEAKSGKLYGLNSSGWAPAGLSIEFLRGKGFTNMPGSGIHSVTVPGCVAGWQATQPGTVTE